MREVGMQYLERCRGRVIEARQPVEFAEAIFHTNFAAGGALGEERGAAWGEGLEAAVEGGGVDGVDGGVEGLEAGAEFAGLGDAVAGEGGV